MDMMTEKEICWRFKRNDCGIKHIRVLAELNAVDDVVICEILEKNGLLKKRPKNLQVYVDPFRRDKKAESEEELCMKK